MKRIYPLFIIIVIIAITLSFKQNNFVLSDGHPYLIYGFANQNSTGLSFFVIYIYLLIGIKFYNNRLVKISLTVLSIIFLILIALTGARSSLFSAMIIFIVSFLNKIPNKKTCIFLSKCFISIPIIIPLLYILLWNTSMNKDLTILGKHFFSERQIIWIEALEILKNNPFINHYGEYDNVANTGTYAHNLYLSIWWQYGIIGLAALIVVLYLLFRSVIKNIDSPIDFLIFSSLGILLLQQSFEETLLENVWLYIMVFNLISLIGVTTFQDKTCSIK
jgi:O-antigen ligase